MKYKSYFTAKTHPDSLRYCSAICGAGKTFGICEETVARVIQGEYVLIVQPTKDLLNDTERRLKERDPSIHVVTLHGDRVETTGGVVAAAYRYLKAPFPEGHVLLITWATFERLRYFHNRGAWTVFLDEPPAGHECIPLKAAVTHTHMTAHIDTHPRGPQYAQIVVRDRNALRRLIATASKDDGLKAFVPLANRLVAGNWSVFVDEAQYRDLLGGRRHDLQTFHILRPRVLQGFKSLTILGARFEETPLYLLLKNDGIRFFEDETISSHLRYKKHEGGDKLTIWYAFDDVWSKTFRDKEDKKPLKLITEATKSLFNANPFIWMGNKDIKDHHFGELKNTRLPNIPHGLNDFQEYNDVAIVSALNPTPSHFRFMESKGIDPEELRTATYHHQVYQAVMRSSLRDPCNQNPKRIIVPDRGTAEWLQSIFRGSTVHSLGIELPVGLAKGKPGRKRIHASDADRKRAHREKEKQEKLAELDSLHKLLDPVSLKRVVVPETSGDILCDENTLLKELSYIVPRFHGTIWDHKYDKKDRHDRSVLFDTVNEFVGELYLCSRRNILSKSANLLISPAFYIKQDGVTKVRGKENILFANGLWLDVDGGDLTHKRFSELFPRIRIIVFNSFSSTKDRPRWRVYIPLSRHVSATVYTALWKEVLHRVREDGFKLLKRKPLAPNVLAHGIDNKMNACDLFYLPCRAKEPGASFFKDYNDDGRELLDPEDWIRFGMVAPETAPAPLPQDSYLITDHQQAEVQRLVATWDANGIKAGQGHGEMFKLYIGLRKAGIPNQVSAPILYEAAARANTPNDRRKQVDELMKFK